MLFKEKSHKHVFMLLLISIGCCVYKYLPNILNIELSDFLWKGIFLIFYLIFIIFVPKKKFFIHEKYDSYFIIINVSIVLSILCCYIYHGQSIITGFIATSIYSIFLIYFILNRTSISQSEIESVLIFMGIINIVIIIVAFVTAPNCAFGAFEIDVARGGFRIRAGVQDWVFLLLAYSMNKISIKFNFKYVVLFFLCQISLFLLLTRQVIILDFIVVFLFIISYSKFKFKIIALAFLLICVFVFVNSDIGQNLIRLTIEQHDRSVYVEDDIRMKGVNFFLYKGQTDILTVLFGNGVWSYNNSEFGHIMDKLGYLPADIGYCGFFFYFGLIALITFLSLILNLIFKRRTREFRFLNIYFFYYGASSFAAGSILYPAQIFIFILMVYYSIITAKKNRIYEK